MHVVLPPPLPILLARPASTPFATCSHDLGNHPAQPTPPPKPSHPTCSQDSNSSVPSDPSRQESVERALRHQQPPASNVFSIWSRCTWSDPTQSHHRIIIRQRMCQRPHTAHARTHATNGRRRRAQHGMRGSGHDALHAGTVPGLDTMSPTLRHRLPSAAPPSHLPASGEPGRRAAPRHHSLIAGAASSSPTTGRPCCCGVLLLSPPPPLLVLLGAAACSCCSWSATRAMSSRSLLRCSTASSGVAAACSAGKSSANSGANTSVRYTHAGDNALQMVQACVHIVSLNAACLHANARMRATTTAKPDLHHQTPVCPHSHTTPPIPPPPPPRPPPPPPNTAPGRAQSAAAGPAQAPAASAVAPWPLAATCAAPTRRQAAEEDTR